MTTKQELEVIKKLLALLPAPHELLGHIAAIEKNLQAYDEIADEKIRRKIGALDFDSASPDAPPPPKPFGGEPQLKMRTSR